MGDWVGGVSDLEEARERVEENRETHARDGVVGVGGLVGIERLGWSLSRECRGEVA